MSGSGRDGPVVLVGLSGTGKSTVAPKLAALLGGDAVDLDQRLVDRIGEPIDDQFRRDGGAAFRRAERDELRLVLDAALADGSGSRPPVVIATGGGVVLDEQNRRALGRCTVVWLRATVDELVDRLRDAEEVRPLLAGDARGALARLGTQRSPLYEQVADIVVDVDGTAVDEVVERVAASLAERR